MGGRLWCSRHICINKNDFISYIQVEKEEEIVYLGTSRTIHVLEKVKVFLKLTFGKSLALSNVLHVPNIKINLISMTLFRKVEIKVIFENNEVILTKYDILIGNGRCNHELYILDIIKNNASASAYMIEFVSLWHSRLGYVNIKYIKNMQSLGLISSLDSSIFDKCEICVKVKITKSHVIN